jgi:hypothetical protein
MNKVCCPLALLLAIALGLGAYSFIWKSSARPASDGRLSIHLQADERDLVLMEMRGFLQSVQQILAASQAKDSAAIVEAARRVGANAQEAVPASLMGKLPMAFKKLGFDTHQRFDQLAMDVEQMKDTTIALEQLGTLMHNCVSCHAAYRIDLSQ